MSYAGGNMETSQTSELVGRCGLYCGACAIYRAERDNPEYRQRLAARFNCAPEQVRCNGCGALTSNCWGWDCKFVSCLREKGLDFCFDCPEYEGGECEKYEKFALAYLNEDGVDLQANNDMIRSGRMAEWLEESRRRYRCAHCSGPIVAGTKKCHHCGQAVRG